MQIFRTVHQSFPWISGLMPRHYGLHPMLQEKHSVIQEGGKTAQLSEAKLLKQRNLWNLLTPRRHPWANSHDYDIIIKVYKREMLQERVKICLRGLVLKVILHGFSSWLLIMKEAHAFATAIGALDDAGQLPSVTQSMAEDMGVLVKIASLLLLVPDSSPDPKSHPCPQS